MRKIPIRGYRLDKNGKLVKSTAHLSVSARLKMKGSKRMKFVRGAR